MRSAAAVVRKSMRLRGPSGLGDSIYLRPISEYLARSGARVEVLSNYPDVFRDAGVIVSPFTRHPPADLTAHYVSGKNDPTTNQFQDMCRSAGIAEAIPLRMKWRVLNLPLINQLHARADGRKLIIVHGGRTPMGRTDGFGAELLPEKAAFDAILSALNECFLVRVGNDTRYPLAVDLDLQGRTSIADLLDIGAVCDGWVAQCSFAVPLAETFGKPLLAVWAAAGLKAPKSYIKTITPQKIFTSPSSAFVVDNWPVAKIKEAALALRGI